MRSVNAPCRRWWSRQWWWPASHCSRLRGAAGSLTVADPPLGEAVCTKAEAGSPPKVCGSPAFNAYGALTSSTRGDSGWPCTSMPSQ
jgi:hypothetical protein